MIKYTKLSNYKIKKILRCFCTVLTAVQISKLLDINRNTVNRFYKIFRESIIELSTIERNGIIDDGEVELDESYFGARKERDKKVEELKVKQLYLES